MVTFGYNIFFGIIGLVGAVILFFVGVIVLFAVVIGVLGSVGIVFEKIAQWITRTFKI